MKITFVLPPVNMSGGIKVVAIYAEALQALGHSVVLISPPPQQIPVIDKLRLLLKGKGWTPDPVEGPSHLDGRGLDHRVWDRFRVPTDDDVPDADVVVATWWETAEWVNELSACKGAKVLFVQHHEVFDYLPVERCKAIYRLPFHKIVIARWLQRTMSQEYGDNYVDLVPNSVDHDQFNAPIRSKQSRPTVGLLFYPVWFKGVEISLQAIELLRKDFPDLRVICFGTFLPDGVAGLDDRVDFYLSPEQHKIRELYAQCDLWMTASRTEGFNLPAMEAMACRTPVVSTRAGWPEEAIIDGHNGYLVDVEDVEGLYHAVSKVLSQSGDDWQTMSQHAFDTVAESTWQASTELFEKALMNACDRAGRGEIAGGCEFPSE